MAQFIKSRLAPTPSGFLHIGNAFSFLLTWVIVRKFNGKLLLRIDDLDRERKRDEYVEDIFRTLNWLQLDWDEGPDGVTSFEKDWTQQSRIPLYEELLEKLKQQNLLFACECSRKTVIANSSDGQYHGTCRNKQIPFTKRDLNWRVKTSLNSENWVDVTGTPHKIALQNTMRDFVVRRKDRLPAYQIASLADDIHFDINTIVRGTDLLASTAAQRYLAHLTNSTGFYNNHFFHHQLLTDESGKKLSKSAGAISLKHWREIKKSPFSLYGKVGKLLGLNTEQCSSPEEIAKNWNGKYWQGMRLHFKQ